MNSLMIVVAFIVSLVVVATGLLVRRIIRNLRNRFTLADLVNRLGMTAEEWSQLKPPTYRTAMIPKRNGGQRMLEIPDPDTMVLQRRILRRVLKRLRSHRAAIGFESGKSIVHAASPHIGQAVVVRVDIENFFQTTTERRVGEWFRAIGWNQEATEFLLMILTHNGHLPQGAPTSPRLSNLVNARLDAGLNRIAQSYGGAYTRYADDITFSFPVDQPRQIRALLQMVGRYLKQAGYQMKNSKTRILRAHARQSVLGLTVNQKVALPRSMRRRLRAIRHQQSQGKPTTMTAAELHGWTAFEQMIASQK
ncbi:MAG: RNA-directed DNA polymerase [Planctomyces sp.]|nr:RNA-directed DNA polymerase [Planctomyces sp.]